jgi:hypothetical protein
MRLHLLIRKFFQALLLLSICIAAAPSRAGTGATDIPAISSSFSYGVRLDPWGQQVEAALKASTEAGLDWISVDLDWERLWPAMSTSMDLAPLDRLMSYAGENGLRVLISISHAPRWVLTRQGPDVDLTAGLVVQLTRLYPNTLLAVELFPSANTARGWGATPNPEAYSELLKVTAQRLEEAGSATFLVAAGLEPIASSAGNPNPEGIDDLDFLQRLYTAGAAKYFSVIGIRIPQTDQEPLAPPWKSDPRVLRHYELVRDVMLKNDDRRGQIWITGYTMPSASSSGQTGASAYAADTSQIQLSGQVRWFNQAFQLTRSHLYIGAVFYACMNPPGQTGQRVDKRVCLLQVDGTSPWMHPAYFSLEEMISLNKSSSQSQLPPKENIPRFSAANSTKVSAP